VTGGGTGTGSGTVRLQAQPNTGPSRAGRVRIAGEALTIDQAAGASDQTCTYGLAPMSRRFGSGAEDVTVEVRSQAGCAWTASSRAAWIDVRGGDSGTGNGSVRLTVAANSGRAARTGTVLIGGISFSVEQDGAPQPCTYTLRPTHHNAGRGPDHVSIEVRSPDECAWTASGGASWVSIAEGRSGTGAGSVRLRIEANAGASRTTTLSIAGQVFTISQDGGCEATLRPARHDAGPGPDDLRIHVKVNHGCAWTASSPVAWATITDGAAESGNGQVRIRIDANPGPPRNAILSIAGEQFTLTQEARR
jgi:hypothetical protein